MALVVAGLAYSVPMLIEVRLSPQINIWVYGFFQHNFDQMMRYGGFRPIVFLPHGLWVAFFALMALVAAVGLWRFGPPASAGLLLAAAGYLGVVLRALQERGGAGLRRLPGAGWSGCCRSGSRCGSLPRWRCSPWSFRCCAAPTWCRSTGSSRRRRP